MKPHAPVGLRCRCAGHLLCRETAGLRTRCDRALALFSPTVGATTICRWVNENGRTQISEVVPDKYKKVATCTDSQKYELSPEQRRAAEQRVAEDRATARDQAAKPPTERASGAPRPAGAASQPGAKRPIEVVTDTTDCPTWWRIYDESVKCFGRTSYPKTSDEKPIMGSGLAL